MRLSYALLVCGLLLTACSSDHFTATPLTLTPTTTPRPSSTLAPTWTRTPSVTPTHTLIPTLRPTRSPILRFKVLSFNVLYGAGIDRRWDSALPPEMVGKNRSVDLIAAIRQSNPDIIGIQEANSWDKGSPSGIQQIAQQVGMNYYLAKTPGGFHLGFLTKFEIVATENLSAQTGKQGVLRVHLRTPSGETIHVFVVHLDPASSETRLCQVDVLLSYLQPYTSGVTLLMGDMNFRAGSPEYKKLEQAGWKTIAVENSWGIDQIWVAPWMRDGVVTQPESLNGFNGLSDHHPVSATIQLYSKPVPPSTVLATIGTPTVAPSLFTFNALTQTQVQQVENFETTCVSTQWGVRGKTEKFTDGALEILGEESWQAWATRYKAFSPGQGVMLRFQTTTESEFGLYFETPVWDSEVYQRFGLNVRDAYVYSMIWEGQNSIRGERLSNDFRLETGIWYHLLLAVDRTGILVQLWDPTDPGHVLKYHQRLGEAWTTHPWLFKANANRGKLILDDWTEFLFGQIQ